MSVFPLLEGGNAVRFFHFVFFCVRFSVFCRFLPFCSSKGRFLEKFSGANFCFWGVVLVLCFWWVFAYVFASFLAVRSRNCPKKILLLSGLVFFGVVFFSFAFFADVVFRVFFVCFVF